MKLIDLTIPLGIGTPAWPTYEPLAGEIFQTPGSQWRQRPTIDPLQPSGYPPGWRNPFLHPRQGYRLSAMDYLVHDAAIVDLSDVCGDYDVYTSKMIEDRVEVKEGDILVIHTGYHHFGWDQPTADEIRYMVKHPGPDREFADWARR